MAWMDANKKYPEAKDLKYSEFPAKFTWKPKYRIWTPRKRGFSIGRLHFVPPGTGELYYMRLLLNFTLGPQSFADIRTVNEVTFQTFRDACYAMGLLEDDKEYIDGIIDASTWATPQYLRRLFFCPTNILCSFKA